MHFFNLVQGAAKDLNSLLIFLQTWIDNLTGNPFRMAFVPYTNLLGNYFYAMFFGFIGGAIYMGTGNIGSTLVYFILVGIFMALVIPSLILAVFGIISGIIVASILYYALVQKKSV